VVSHTNNPQFVFPGDPSLASCQTGLIDKKVEAHKQSILPRLNNSLVNQMSGGDIENHSVLSPKFNEEKKADSSVNTVEVNSNYRQILKFKGDMHEVKKDINSAVMSKEAFMEKTRLTMNIFHNTKRD
jgi:hypothetical protein